MAGLLSKLKYYFSIGCFSLKLILQSQLEYPTFLIGWFLSNALQFLVGIATLKLLMVNFPYINGWSFDQVAFMYGIGIISHSLSIIFFIQTWSIEWSVVQGEFDRMLLRPMAIFFQFSISYINLIGLTDMLPGIIIFGYGANAVGFQFSIANMIRLFMVIVGATLLRGAIYTMTGSVAFWTKRSYGLIQINLGLFERTIMYPTTIFGRFMQGVFTFILPLAFISFYPAAQLLGKDTGFYIPGEASLWTLGIGIFAMLLAIWVFNKGMRRYDSTGS